MDTLDTLGGSFQTACRFSPLHSAGAAEESHPEEGKTNTAQSSTVPASTVEHSKKEAEGTLHGTGHEYGAKLWRDIEMGREGGREAYRAR